MNIFKKPVYKSRTDKKIDGVCGGIANALEIHSSWVRIGFILSIIFGGAGIIAYILLDIALEKEPN